MLWRLERRVGRRGIGSMLIIFRYQTVLPSALVSNPGFVAQMGILRLGAGNTRALDPVHIHAWSGMYMGRSVTS